jgi:hypothetical protein
VADADETAREDVLDEAPQNSIAESVISRRWLPPRGGSEHVGDGDSLDVLVLMDVPAMSAVSAQADGSNFDHSVMVAG